MQYGDPLHYKVEFERFFRVTSADLARVAKQYLTPECVVLNIQPMAEGETQTPAFLAGPLPTGAKIEEPKPRTPTGSVDWSRMPPPSPPRAFVPPAFQRQALTNGMVAYTAPWKALPLVSMRIIIPVGSADDPVGKEGLAQLAAKMLTQGTDKLTAVELAAAFRALGATVSTGVGSDNTEISIDVMP